MPTYDSSWEDMSDFVVHYTRDGGDESDYKDFLSILGSGLLRGGGPHGLAGKRAPASAPHLSVCLSEIPLDMLDRLLARRGRYGIGFTKDFVLQRGGGPVWYVERGGEADSAVETLIAHALENPDDDVSKAIWEATPFIDGMGHFSSGPYRFEWEREWRVIGSLAFRPSDVALLLMPESQHDYARTFFADAQIENIGPNYTCPMIDPTWPREQIRAALGLVDESA